MTNKVSFKQIPIKDLAVSLADFQGRTEAYSSTTYHRIINEVKAGIFNFSALPAIQIWMDPRTHKWTILAGHSRTAAFADLAEGKVKIPNDIYTPQDFETIHAQIVAADTLQEATKIAQESNAAGAQSELDFAMKMVKPMRQAAKNNTEFWQKMKDLFGKNAIYINELSYLNPDGKTVSMLRQTANLSDQSQAVTVQKIASFIGSVREKIPALTNAHENELYDWLVKNINNERNNSKMEFVANISSRVMRLDFDATKPLNLDNVATKSYIEVGHEQQISEKRKQIEEKQAEYKKERDRYMAANLSIEKMEELLDPADKYILRLQRELRDMMLKNSEVKQQSHSIIGLFDNPAPPPANNSADMREAEESLKTLIKMLRLVVSPNTLTDKKKIKALVQQKNYEEPTGAISFESKILSADFAKGSGSKYKYHLLTPFLLHQLDWWLHQFELRFVDKTIPENTRYNYDPGKIREQYNYEDVDMLKQICETAIHIFADKLIAEAQSTETAYQAIILFYKNQPKIIWRSSKSMTWQQYSTPIPIAYLMSRWAIGNAQPGAQYLEPSAGTGLLTIGTPPQNWTVNEIDKDRLLCMKFLGFEKTLNGDSNQPLHFETKFDAILTNPPFGKTPVTKFDNYKLIKIEHTMAAYALLQLKIEGKAAVIIGGKSEYNDMGMIVPFPSDRVFLSYLYKTYNVVDIINIDGQMYTGMGAAMPVRVILIDGESTPVSQKHPYYYEEIKDLAPTQTNSPHLVKTYEELFLRFNLHK